MLRVALGYVRSRAVAEEVVQEAWLGVLNGLDRFEGRSSVKTWVYRILANTAKTRGERESRTVPFLALELAGDDQPVDAERFLDAQHPRWPGHWASPPQRWDEIPEQRLLGTETRAELEAAVAGLPPGQRIVLSLRDIEGWSAAEVCEALDLTETNQRVLLHRARSAVRKELEKYLDR